MRPVTLIGRVAEQGFKVIRHVYPYAFDEEPVHPASGSHEHVSCLEDQAVAGAQCNGAARIRRMVCYRGRSGVVLAVNLRGLAREAQRLGCIIEFAVQVGDFIATDEPLFYLSGASITLSEEGERRLQNLECSKAPHGSAFSHGTAADAAISLVAGP